MRIVVKKFADQPKPGCVRFWLAGEQCLGALKINLW